MEFGRSQTADTAAERVRGFCSAAPLLPGRLSQRVMTLGRGLRAPATFLASWDQTCRTAGNSACTGGDSSGPRWREPPFSLPNPSLRPGSGSAAPFSSGHEPGFRQLATARWCSVLGSWPLGKVSSGCQPGAQQRGWSDSRPGWQPLENEGTA
jgi:hypothetical protein